MIEENIRNDIKKIYDSIQSDYPLFHQGTKEFKFIFKENIIKYLDILQKNDLLEFCFRPPEIKVIPNVTNPNAVMVTISNYD
jgi:hypothetical protein